MLHCFHGMRLLLGFAFFAVSLHAASFVQVSCGAPTGQPVRNTETANSLNCDSFVSGAESIWTNGGSRANGSVILEIPADPSQYINLLTHQNAVVYQATPAGYPGPGAGLGSSAYVTVNYYAKVRAAGDLRPGYIQIRPNNYGNG